MKRTTKPPVREEKVQTLSNIKRLQILSETMNRAALNSRLGKQYSGDRDVYQALGWPQEIIFEDYLERYSRQDIAKAIIDRPVAYTWKGPVLITEVGQNEDTELEKAWLKLERTLKVKSKFVRCDKLSGIGQYGIMLLGFDDINDVEGFMKPVKSGKRKLLYIKPLSEGAAKIATYVTNTSDSRYGMVETYNIEYEAENNNPTNTHFKVHHSRVVHVVPELMQSEITGEPVLKPVWNRLLDLDKLVGGSAEMFWRGARPGYQGKIDPEYTLTSDEEDQLQDQINEYEHNLRRMLLNAGVEFSALQTQVSDPLNHVDVQLQMISAITGIPKRILTGSERGELSSGQDLTGWYTTIQTRREEHAEFSIVRPFVDRMIEYGVLPKPSTGDYQVAWSDLFAASDKDQAEVGRVRATALKEYSQNPGAELVVPPDAFMEFMLGLDEDERMRIREMSSALKTDEDRLLLTPEEEALEMQTRKVATQPVKTNGNGSD